MSAPAPNGRSLFVAVISALALLMTLIGTIIVAVVYIGKLDSRTQQLEGKHSRPDPWTGKDTLFWSVQLKDANPQLKMPTPKHQPDE